MMDTIVVKLETKDSDEVERLNYEYNASLNIIAFLMSKEEVRDEHLQRYLDCSELKFTALEIAKETVSEKYRPQNLVGPVNYSFDFRKEEISYWQ